MTDGQILAHLRYDRHSGKRLRETMLQETVFLPAEPRQSRAGITNTEEKPIMHARQILATAALCTLLTGAGFAQVTGRTIQQRKNHQQERIGQGVRSGQLTAREKGHLERREASVNRQEHAMRRADGGRLTAHDKAVLTRRQNRISRSIYKDKHNARVR
jgi:hypothetical protein